MNAGPLNLADADLKGFEALDSGRYDAEIFEIKMDAVKNEGGKTPVGTPMMKIQCRILNPQINHEPVEQDRRVFTQFVIPPKGYDPKKAATMNGMIARFFIASGDTEEQVRSKTFDPDFEDYKGRPLVVILSKVQKYGTKPEDSEWENKITGFKPAGSATGGNSGLL